MESVQPEVLLLTYLYFLQGLPYGLQARFLPIYFRAKGMSLTNISYIKALFFPWMCKTLWAPLVDHHGNKKTWLQWSMAGLCVTCIFASGIEPSWMLTLCAILLLFNLLTSTQDIATDGLAIEILTSSQVANGNIAQVVGFKFGAIIGGGLLAWLSDHISWSAIFVVLACIYLSAVGVVKICVPAEIHSTFGEFTLEVASTSDNDCSDVIDCPTSSYTKSSQLSSKATRTPTSEMVSELLGPAGEHYLKTSASETTASNREKCVNYTSMHEGKSASPSSFDLDAGKKSGVFRWIMEHFANVLRAEGTFWILLYVLVYKLGEQGALNMMPMFLIDHGVSTTDVGLWTGVVGQAISIAGSVLGGVAISSLKYSPLKLLLLLNVVKVVVLACEWWAVATWVDGSDTLMLGTGPCIVLMLGLLLVSGAVSTSAFTLMMHCSQRAHPRCRASHYSLLATVEVLGKLLFSIFVGAITDAVGYSLAFALFFTLSVCVLPLFWHSPQSFRTVGTNKNC